MKLHDVYTLFEVEPVRGLGCKIYDREGTEYLDFYGGHAVISIGHAHSHYVDRISSQVANIGFYSNSVQNSLQQQVADKLEQLSGIKGYELFFINSGAEANENALKLASFYNGRSKVLAFNNGFHGRTSAAINVTHSGQKHQSNINQGIEVVYSDFNDQEGTIKAIESNKICAVIVEVIQGVGGLDNIDDSCLVAISEACEKTDTILILDEIQAGYGRSGKFFAFQQSGINPDIITVAKGMGNGFPIGGVLINAEKMPAVKGRLGTTFGGSHLACASALAVLEVIEQEDLVTHCNRIGDYLNKQIQDIPHLNQIKGRGLMVGIEFNHPIAELRKNLVYKHKVFTGNSINPNLLRILPPLNIKEADVNLFVSRLRSAVNESFG